MSEWELHLNIERGQDGSPCRWDEWMCTVCARGRDKRLERSKRECALASRWQTGGKQPAGFIWWAFHQGGGLLERRHGRIHSEVFVLAIIWNTLSSCISVMWWIKDLDMTGKHRSKLIFVRLFLLHVTLTVGLNFTSTWCSSPRGHIDAWMWQIWRGWRRRLWRRQGSCPTSSRTEAEQCLHGALVLPPRAKWQS